MHAAARWSRGRLPRGALRERLFAAIAELQHGSRTADPATAYQAARIAGCTPQHAYQFIEDLRDAGVVDHFEIVAPRDYFDRWLEERVAPVRLDFQLPNVQRWLIGRRKTNYALTTYAGEWATTHYLSAARWDLYVPPLQLSDWARELTERRGALRGSGNLRLLIADPFWSDPQNCRTSRGYNVVWNSRLIVDLLAEGGIANEAADRLIGGWRKRTRTQKRT